MAGIIRYQNGGGASVKGTYDGNQLVLAWRDGADTGTIRLRFADAQHRVLLGTWYYDNGKPPETERLDRR